MRNIRFAFADAIEALYDYQCPAVQDAIDVVAADSEQGATPGRVNLLVVLRRTTTTDDDFCDWVLVRWGRAPLKLATGRSRDEWIDLINQPNP